MGIIRSWQYIVHGSLYLWLIVFCFITIRSIINQSRLLFHHPHKRFVMIRSTHTYNIMRWMKLKIPRMLNIEIWIYTFHEKVAIIFLDIHNIWPKSVFNQEMAGNSRQYMTKGPTFVLEVSKFVGNKTYTYNVLSSTRSRAQDWMWPIDGF